MTTRKVALGVAEEGEFWKVAFLKITTNHSTFRGSSLVFRPVSLLSAFFSSFVE